MLCAADVLSFLRHLVLLPRRLLLETPEVQATVPMLRGVWGAALHGLDQETYRLVFAPNATGAVAGYLLRPGPPDPSLAPALDWFLFGDAVGHDPLLQRAWDVASGLGLGPQRRRWYIRRQLTLGPDGQPTPSSQPWQLDAAAWPLPDAPATAPCQLWFPSPLRLLRKGRLIEEPTLVDLIVAAARRVEAFLPVEEQTPWRVLREDLLTLARRCPAGTWKGGRLDLVRWSARQQAELDLHGVSGVLDLPEGPGELWPLLAAAVWLHLGKGTTVGLGEMQIRPWGG
jgi:hypothetical protein